MSKVKGGRRTELEKTQGPKCAGKADPITFEPIPPEFAIRLLEQGYYHCFDIRELKKWFDTGRRSNPTTNLNFSQANIAKIQKKIVKVGLGPAPIQTYISPDDIALLDYIQTGRGLNPFDITVYKPDGQDDDRYIQHKQFTIDFDVDGQDIPRGYEMVIVPGAFNVLFFTKTVQAYTDLGNFLTQHIGRNPDQEFADEIDWVF